MAKSIRLRLLGWNAALLVGVVGSFATVLYWRERSVRLGAIDADLAACAAGLESTLRLFPPHELLGVGPPHDFDVPPDFEPPDRPADSPRPWPPPRPPFGQPGKRPPGDGPPDRGHLLASLSLPGPPGTYGESFYFGVWRADGSVLKVRGLPEDTAAPAAEPPRAILRTHGPDREIVVAGPHRTVVLVGAPVGRQLADMVAFAGQLATIGAAVVGLGLTGVWFLSRRAFQPVADIASTASRISAENLSGRIDTHKLDAELLGLADVLNATFARLEAAFERQARFTADASHELRTPLAVVRARAELILARPRGEEEYRDAMLTCLRATERMAGLVDHLLLLARADAGWPGMKQAPVAFDHVVEEALAQLQASADAKGLRLERNLAPARVFGDGEALARVCLNLLANAVQYSHPGGKVDVSLVVVGGEAEFTVADGGIGIAEADRPRVFERFYRADKARSRASGGSGLGLAICKAIVEAHHGSISFAPTPGGGSTFLVRLPHLPHA